MALLVAVRNVLSAGGATWVVVSGWSMTPLIRPGDRVLLEGRSMLRAGDIILANCEARAVLHRIARVTGDELAIRGDHTGSTVQVVRRDSVIGCAILLQRGRKIIALRPTLRFGLRPLLLHGFVQLWLWVRSVRQSVKASSRRSDG
jgi:hypothetical protein